MNCIEFEAALEFSVETRQPLEPLALKHTLSCDNCRSEWEVHRQLDTAIDAWRSDIEVHSLASVSEQQLASLASTMHPDALPADLCDLVLAELRQPALTSGLTEPDARTHHRSSRMALRPKSKGSDLQSRSGLLAVASVAACLILAVIFATNQAGRNSAELAQVSPAAVIEQATSPTPLDVSQTLTAVFSDIRSEYREMASETTSVARDLANVFPQHITVPFQASHEDVERRPTSGDVVRIWRPISSRVESALGFLWQAVPSEVPAG